MAGYCVCILTTSLSEVRDGSPSSVRICTTSKIHRMRRQLVRRQPPTSCTTSIDDLIYNDEEGALAPIIVNVVEIERAALEFHTI